MVHLGNRTAPFFESLGFSHFNVFSHWVKYISHLIVGWLSHLPLVLLRSLMHQNDPHTVDVKPTGLLIIQHGSMVRDAGHYQISTFVPITLATHLLASRNHRGCMHAYYCHARAARHCIMLSCNWIRLTRIYPLLTRLPQNVDCIIIIEKCPRYFNL